MGAVIREDGPAERVWQQRVLAGGAVIRPLLPAAEAVLPITDVFLFSHREAPSPRSSDVEFVIDPSTMQPARFMGNDGDSFGIGFSRKRCNSRPPICCIRLISCEQAIP